jgi:hypothetical protein
LLAELARSGGLAARVADDLVKGRIFQDAIASRFVDLSPPIKTRLRDIDRLDKAGKANALLEFEKKLAGIIEAEAEFSPGSIVVDLPPLDYIQEVKQRVLLRNGSYALLTERSSFAERINELFRDYYRAHVFVRDWAAYKGTDRRLALDAIRAVMEIPE